METDVPAIIYRGAELTLRDIEASQGKGDQLLDLAEESLVAPLVQQILQPRLFAIGAIAMIDENPQNCVGEGNTFLRLDKNAAVAREVFVAGDAAQCESKVHARGKFFVFIHADGCESDVIGVFERADRAAAIEGDVEFSRQAIKLTMVEDEMVQFFRQRTRVDQFLRIDSRGWAGGDVADVVRAGAAVDDSQVVQRLDDLGRI